MQASQDSLQQQVPPSPSVTATDDGVQSYVALAIPLLHVLQKGQVKQAALVARHMTQRWGEAAGPAAKLLKLLDSSDHEDADDVERSSEDADPGSSGSGAHSGLEDNESNSSSSSDNDIEDVMDEQDVLQVLQQIVKQLPSSANERLVADGKAGEDTATAATDDIEMGIETEEERRILEEISGAVEREMARLAIVRKHR